MSGETEKQVSAWTTDSLKEHVEALMNERDRRYEQRFQAQEAAVKAAIHSADRANSKAEAAMEKRFDGVNEFRQTLSDQAGQFITRQEVETMFKPLDSKVDENKDTLKEIVGRASGLHASWGYTVGAVGIVAAVVAVLR